MLENAIAAAAMIGFKQASDRERDRGDVVGEGPEEVALDRAQRPAGEADRVRRRAQVARDEGDVAGFDRNVGAGADRDPEVGLGERRSVVDAVADHGDDLAGLLQPAHLGHLVLGVHLREHALDPDLVRDPLRRRARVAGQ